MAAGTQMRTVRFFEIIDHKTSMPLESDLPWPDAIRALEQVGPRERTVPIGGDDHHGGPWSVSGLPEMLLMSKIRGDFALPELIDRNTGVLEALRIAETQGIAETTHLGFFPSNIVGMIRTNTTPGATSFEKWLNSMNLFGEQEPFAVIPLSRVEVQSRVNDIESARGVKIRMRSTASQAIADKAPRISAVTQTLEQQFGPVMVEMRVYLTQNDGLETPESAAIMAEATGLLALTQAGSIASGVDAASMTYLSRESEAIDEFNMFNDKLAEKVAVEVVDEKGLSTRRESAAKAMALAYDHLKKDLQAAVGRDRA